MVQLIEQLAEIIEENLGRNADAFPSDQNDT